MAMEFLPISKKTMISAPYLVKDLNSGSSGSFPSGFTSVNGNTYFFADGGINDYALWKTDGTSIGTIKVKNVPAGKDNNYWPISIKNSSKDLFFFTTDTDSSIYNKLWKSDGTECGTVIIKDQLGIVDIYRVLNVDDILYFTAGNTDTGYELWKSDGTASGTLILKDIATGSDSSYPSDLNHIGNILYFFAYNDTSGYELWQSDGTEAGTVLLKDIVAGSQYLNLSSLTNIDNTLYFNASSTSSENTLWKSDGTEAGTVPIKVIGSGMEGLRQLKNVNGLLYFFSNNDSFGSNGFGYSLWKSDGTEVGTELIKDINLGNASPGASVFGPSSAININGVFFFAADDGSNGQELWISDGTESGTVMLKNIKLDSGSSEPSNFIDANGVLFFTANSSNDSNIRELWTSDGTEAGTVLVSDSISINNSPMFFVNEKLFLSADDGSGYELWALDVSNSPF